MSKSTNNLALTGIEPKFTGKSLASACSSAIKNILNNLNTNNNIENNTDSSIGRTPIPVVALQQDMEEEEDNSDICSLPECDSDLLG